MNLENLNREQLENIFKRSNQENDFLLDQTNNMINSAKQMLFDGILTMKALVLGNQDEKMKELYNQQTESIIEEVCNLLISDQDMEDAKKRLSND